MDPKALTYSQLCNIHFARQRPSAIEGETKQRERLMKSQARHMGGKLRDKETKELKDRNSGN